jgi:hypothetical protein
MVRDRGARVTPVVGTDSKLEVLETESVFASKTKVVDIGVAADPL